MHPIRFDAEHRAVFAGSADSLFSWRALEAATVDFEPDALGSMTGPARVFAGVDWGASVDRSAAVAIGRLLLGDGGVFAVRGVRRWPAGWPLHAVAEEFAASPAHFAGIYSEVNGLGAAATEILWRAVLRRPYEAGGGVQGARVALAEDTGDPFRDPPRRPRRRRAGFVTRRWNVVTSAPLKAAAWGALQLMVGQRRLLIPASATDLLRELRLLKVDLSPGSGVERIEASSGHDDLADALMLASGPFRRRDGRWSSLLAEEAQRRAAGLGGGLGLGGAAASDVGFCGGR